MAPTKSGSTHICSRSRSRSRSRAHAPTRREWTPPSITQNEPCQTLENHSLQSQQCRRIASGSMDKAVEPRRGRSKSRSRIHTQDPKSLGEQVVRRKQDQSGNASIWSPYKANPTIKEKAFSRAVFPSPVPSFYSVPRRLPVESQPMTPSNPIPMNSFLSSTPVHIHETVSRKRQGDSISSEVTSIYGKKAFSDKTSLPERAGTSTVTVSVDARTLEVVATEITANKNGNIMNNTEFQRDKPHLSKEKAFLGIPQDKSDVEVVLVPSSDEDSQTGPQGYLSSACDVFASSYNAPLTCCSPSVSSAHVDTRPARRLPRAGHRVILREPTDSPESNNLQGSGSKRRTTASKHLSEKYEIGRDRVSHLLATGNVAITPLPTPPINTGIKKTNKQKAALELTTFKTHSIESSLMAGNERYVDGGNVGDENENQDSPCPIIVSTQSVRMKSEICGSLSTPDTVIVDNTSCSPDNGGIDINFMEAVWSSNNMKDDTLELPHSEIQTPIENNLDHRNVQKFEHDDATDETSIISNDQQIKTHTNELSEDEKFEDSYENLNEFEDIKTKKKRSWCSIA